MNRTENRGVSIALLGALMTTLSLIALIWRPTDDVNELVALLLVVSAIVGIGLVVSGSSSALRNNEPDRHD